MLPLNLIFNSQVSILREEKGGGAINTKKLIGLLYKARFRLFNFVFNWNTKMKINESVSWKCLSLQVII